jgi:ribosome-associated protein
MIIINEYISISETEVLFQAIRAQGAGGQNVNKVSSAIHLRFDIQASSLPEQVKEKLLALSDTRISKVGVVVIKAQNFRTREKNREDAIGRLVTLVKNSLVTKKKRRNTKPKRGSVIKRLDRKTKHSRTKKLRGKVDY